MRRVKVGPAFYTVEVRGKLPLGDTFFDTEEEANEFARVLLEGTNADLLDEVSIVKSETLVCFSNDPKKETHE